jgi:hypothetical protein
MQPFMVGVQTAFQEFGEIITCSIVNPGAFSLSANVVFKSKADAERAVQRLE